MQDSTRLRQRIVPGCDVGQYLVTMQDSTWLRQRIEPPRYQPNHPRGPGDSVTEYGEAFNGVRRAC